MKSLIPAFLFDLQLIEQQSTQSNLESSSKKDKEHHDNSFNLVWLVC